MSAASPEATVENGAPVRYAAYDGQALQYRYTDDETRTGAIPNASFIAMDRTDTEGPQLVYADAKRNVEDGGSPVALKHLYIQGLPEDLLIDLPSPLPLSDSRHRTDFIISTLSGTGLAENVWNDLIEPALALSHLRQDADYHVFRSTSETTISELARDRILAKANRGEQQTVVLLSGDGGMVDLINTLIAGPRSDQYLKPKVGLLPLGTGNALANSSGITGDDTFGLRALFRGQAREVPVFQATFSPGTRLLTNEGREERELDGRVGNSPAAHGAVVCSWGLHATLVADSDTTEYRKFGAQRFQMAGKEALHPSDGSLPHAYRGKVSIWKPGWSNWTLLDRQEHGYVLATLCSHLEANFRISPSSQPLDGRLRLVHFGRLSGDDAMGIMTKAYQDGQHVYDERVGYEVIEGLRIEFGEDDARWRRVCIDGKIIRVERDGWVVVAMRDAGVVDLIAP